MKMANNKKGLAPKKNSSGSWSHIKFSFFSKKKAECNLLKENRTVYQLPLSVDFLFMQLFKYCNFHSYSCIQETIILKDIVDMKCLWHVACSYKWKWKISKNLISDLTRNSNNCSEVITWWKQPKSGLASYKGFIKGRAPGNLTSCKWDLAINLPGCFRLLFLLSLIRKTKNARLKNATDLLHKNLMKPLKLWSRI